jgi:hypothetical protein
LSLLDPLGPPGKARRRANAGRVLLESGAVGDLDLFELLEARECAIDEDGIGQWPQVFGRLELGRIGREKQQVDVLGYPQTQTGMPAGTIQDQHNLLGRTRASLAGERG